MAVILKCKMCGGDLAPAPGESVTECEFCGTKQTVPNQDNEKKLTLFSRANRLRFGCEFDKAAGIYESIIAEFPEEAEAYWGLVLCKYGIEYVDDPATGKKIPTCHRSSFDSVMDDPNLEQALENADAMARRVYRDEAKAIEELRKSIIEVSGREEPYDIFICYKETAPDGNRTVDSVIAQDVYDALTEKGYRVFFSRVTLEDKLGQEYEPYIFAALNSAKLMLAFGTDYEYYNAVWVKNEWSRFLKLMAQDKGKYLIPCYKNLDPYDMPKEFAKLQAQDMGKVGAIQDLLRGIEKILGVKKTEAAPQPAASAASGGPNTASLLERGMLFLEDGEFDEAAGYFNRVLDIDPRSAEAYLGLWMVEVKAKNEADAKTRFVTDFDKKYSNNRSWKRAKQFATALFAEKLNRWESERAAEEKLFLERKALIRKLTETLSSIQKRQAAAQEAERQRRMAAQEAERKRQIAARDEEILARETERQKQIAELKQRLVHLSPEEKNAPAYQRLVSKADMRKEEAQTKETAYRTALEIVNREKSCLQTEIETKEKQKASLGIFSGKEKKELQQKIDELSKKLAELENGLAEKQSTMEETKARAVRACLALDVYTKTELLKNKPERMQKLQELGVAKNELQKLDVPLTVKFGRYMQHKNDSAAPIEWLVLDLTPSRVLLISRFALDCKPYNTSDAEVTWERCTLRNWLNEDFFNAAFTDGEKAMIPTVTVSADKNPKYNTNPGSATEDKVFLLSITEANRYFKSDKERMCVPTAHVKANGGWKPNDCWWLRSSGSTQHGAAIVSRDGGVADYGIDVINGYTSVRPALWIDLSD